MDFDDVLVDFSQLMFSYIRENWRKFKRYFWDPGNLGNKEIQSREFYYMNEWLIHKKYINLTSEQYSAVSLKIWSIIVSEFFESDIYANSLPSKFAEKTLRNPLFIDSNRVKQVIILSRNITKTQEESKKEFIKRFFNHPKISYINVEGRDSKAAALKKNGINFDVFVDDEMPNIRDVAETFRDNLEKKEFIIPRYGYNDPMPKELKFLIETKGGIITYYEPFGEEVGK